MRMAWPERVVLIVVIVLAVLAVEIVVLVAANHAPLWITITVCVAAVVGDLWGALRLIDWMFAGPAQRRGCGFLYGVG